MAGAAMRQLILQPSDREYMASLLEDRGQELVEISDNPVDADDLHAFVDGSRLLRIAAALREATTARLVWEA